MTVPTPGASLAALGTGNTVAGCQSQNICPMEKCQR